MWYVMQVVSGQENRTVLMLERIVSAKNLQHCFVPTRRLKKKFHGIWNEVEEKLFPGYVFLVADQPRLLYEELKTVPALTKILGKCGEYFTPLPEKDVEMLGRMVADKEFKENEKREFSVGISQVMIRDENQLKVLSGPLRNMEGQIKKVNLHKRIAEVEMEFMGSKRLVYMGFEITEEKLKCQ